MLLTIVALWRPWSRIRLAYAAALLFSLICRAGSTGGRTGWLYTVFLPLRAIRVPSRMGMMVGFTLAVLTGCGVARLIRGMSRRRRVMVTIGLAALVLSESRSVPLDLTIEPTSPPPIYADLLHDLGNAPSVAIVDLPLGREDTTFMYYSTFHWQGLVNGYSGFFPPTYLGLIGDLETFPSDRAIEALRQHNARYVVLHGEWYEPADYNRLVGLAAERPDLKLVSTREWQDSKTALYRIAYSLAGP